MAEPKVSILLTLVDKMTAPVEGARSAIGKFGASLKGLGTEAMDLLNNKLIQGVGFAGMLAGLNKSFDAADAFRVALQKLEGTAKITGIPIEYLTGIAEQATEQFKLSKTQAADFAVEMAKLASKAGDVGKAGPALQAFLDIGAARGLTAGETLKAVQQAILGIDEGTDKLFNANPSVLYKQFADAIGESVGKLTDQQKAQALLNAAMTDGSKVQGTYQEYLASTAGQLEIAKNKTESAYATMGVALNDLRQSMASAIAWLAEKFTQFIGGIQILGADAALAILGVPDRFRIAWGQLMQAIANTMGESEVLTYWFGDRITAIADKVGASADKMVAEARKNLRNLKQGHDETVAQIVAVVGAGEKKQTDLLKAGGAARTAAVKGAAKEVEAVWTGSANVFKDAERQREEAAREADSVIRQSWGLSSNYIIAQTNKVVASHRVQAAALATIVDGLDGVYGAATSATPKVKDVGDELRNGARGAISLASEMGVIDKTAASVLNNVVNLSDALKDGLKGISAGNLVGAVGALAGILGSMFSDGPQEKARRELIQKNTQRLQELKDRMGELLNISTPGGKITAFQGVNPDALIASGIDISAQGLGRRVGIGQIGRFLAKQGLSITDMRDMAKEFGIDLGDDGKNFSVDGIRAFFKVLNSEQFTGFDNSLTGDLSRLDFTTAATGGGSSGFLSGLAGILGGPNGSSALGGLFDGVNVSDGVDAAEASTIRGRTTGLATRFANGQVSAAELGGASNADFIRIIELILSKLDDIAGATSATADGVASGAMATTVGVQTADSYAMTGFNAGRV